MMQPASGNTIYSRFHELAVASSLDDRSLQPTRVWVYLEGQQSDGMCLFVRVGLQHLRKATALYETDDWEEADALLRNLLKLDADNSAAKSLCKKLAAKKAAYLKKKAMYGKMFG